MVIITYPEEGNHNVIQCSFDLLPKITQNLIEPIRPVVADVIL